MKRKCIRTKAAYGALKMMGDMNIQNESKWLRASEMCK